MDIKALTPAEQLYAHTQSQQLIMQTGQIGYLHGDMGRSGDEMVRTWNNSQKALKTEGFLKELGALVDSLRAADGPLHDRTSCMRFCEHAEEAGPLEDEGGEYGFRVDTEQHAYLFRVNPHAENFNFYCFCYRRDQLDRHMQYAEWGIPFVTPDCKVIFRLEDGGTIRIRSPDGAVKDHVCRYIDDAHMEASGRLFHVIQFAKLMDENDSRITPIRRVASQRASLKRNRGDAR